MRPLFGRLFGNAYVLLLVATLGWGGNAVAGKLATTHWSPFTLTCIRWLLVILFLLPFAWRHMVQDKTLIFHRWWYFMFAGAAMAFFNLAMYLALNYTTAINVSIEQASMPMFIILANFLVLSQRVTVLQIIGLLISILGVIVTTRSGDVFLIIKNGLNKGDAIMLLGCFFYAVYTFILRWRPPVHWLTFMCLLAVGAFMVSVPFALFEVNQEGLGLPGKSAWMLVLFVVIVPSIVSQLSFAKSVELIGGNRAGVFINLVPVFGSILAVLIIGEQFQIFHAVGMLLVIGGILLVAENK